MVAIPYEEEPVTTDSYFQDHGLVIDHADLLSHATTLAEVVRRSHGGKDPLIQVVRISRSKGRWPEVVETPLVKDPWPTTRTFFEVVSRARYFIHFATWGISHKMIGALKLASMRVPVYGWASNVESHVRVELNEYPDETPNFTAKVMPSDQHAPFDSPHQKLVVVDGPVAFKGSANLTNSGMRKADRGLDIHETVTDYAEVTKLNNKFFAQVWKTATAPGDTFDPYPHVRYWGHDD